MINSPDSARLLGLPSALVASALLLLVTLTYPLNIDSSVHAYMAGMLLKGYWPYIHLWENNFPGTILFVHLPELLLFGRDVVLFHLWDILWQLIGGVLIYRLVEQSAGRLAAWLAVVLTSVFYVTLDNLNVAQRDCYATIILLGALYVVRNHRRTASAAWAGLLYGIAILIRPTNEAYVLAIAVLLLLEEGRADLHWKRAILFGLTAQVGVLLFMLVYWWVGGLDDFLTIAYRFNTEVYAHTLPLSGLFWALGRYWILVLLAAVGVYVWKAKERYPYLGLLLASFVTLVPQKRYVYQYHTTVIILVIFAAAGAQWMIGRLVRTGSLRRAGAAALVVLILLALYSRGLSQKRVLFGLLRGNEAHGPIYWLYDTSSVSGYRVLDSVGEYLKAHVPPSGSFQVVGEYAYPLYRADRIAASRFITFHSLTLRGPSGELTDFQIRWRRELLDSIERKRADYIVVADAPEFARGHLNGLLGHEILQRDFTALDSLLTTHYHFESKIGGFTLYRRG